MRTNRRPENPFSTPRHAYAWETIAKHGPSVRHLDYGAYDGAVLDALLESGVVVEGHGVDVSPTHMATGRSVAGAHLHVIKSGEALPFPDGYFASASCLDVLEHVVDQVGMLRELRRVIEPLNGFLVVTVPKQHVLSFLDTGNIKFRTPRLHHLAYRVAGRDHIYRERFVQMTGGLFGDMEPGKNWHQHFTVEQLTSLIERNRFRVEEFDGAGLFHRALRLLEVTTPLRARGIIGRVVRADEHRFASTHLFCVARPTE